MGLRDVIEDAMANQPSLDDTTKRDKEQIDRATVRSLLGKHTEIHNLSFSSVACARVLETTRWVLAFDDQIELSTRRLEAQKRVKEDDGVELQTVQQAVRDMYGGQYGRETAQQLFDEDLDDLESAYETKIENR